MQSQRAQVKRFSVALREFRSDPGCDRGSMAVQRLRSALGHAQRELA